MNIPDQAIEAAARTIPIVPDPDSLPYMREVAKAALTAALPHIEAALRQQIATDIRKNALDMQDAADTFGVGTYSGTISLKADGMELAARITEKGTTK